MEGCGTSSSFELFATMLILLMDASLSICHCLQSLSQPVFAGVLKSADYFPPFSPIFRNILQLGIILLSIVLASLCYVVFPRLSSLSLAVDFVIQHK